jgi:hypothetical protein
MMQRLHSFNLAAQFFLQINREDGCPVFPPFPAPDKNEPLAKINILNAQADTLEQSQATAIQELRHQRMLARHRAEQSLNLSLDEHSGWILLLLAADRGNIIIKRSIKNFPIKNDQGVQGLSLGGSSHLALGYEMGKKPLDILGCQFVRMSLAAIEGNMTDKI